MSPVSECRFAWTGTDGRLACFTKSDMNGCQMQRLNNRLHTGAIVKSRCKPEAAEDIAVSNQQELNQGNECAADVNCSKRIAQQANPAFARSSASI